jgi:hypothetical protein
MARSELTDVPPGARHSGCPGNHGIGGFMASGGCRQTPRIRSHGQTELGLPRRLPTSVTPWHSVRINPWTHAIRPHFQKGGPIGPNAANSCRLRLQGKCPVRSRSRQRAEVAVAVNARRQHQNGDAVKRRARSANRCVPGAWFASTCNRREIPTIPYGWAKWKALSLACSRWRGARNLARALGAAYRADSAWRGDRTDVRSALEPDTREVAAR